MLKAVLYSGRKIFLSWLRLLVMRYSVSNYESSLTIDIVYQPELEQVKTLSQVFENPYLSRDQNIHFSGATYKCIKADKYSIYATKVM